MMVYFEIARASCGSISWEYLERLPIDKLSYLYRAARASNVRGMLDSITSVNLGFAGNTQRMDNLQRQLEHLTFTEPKTDTAKLDKWKKKLADARKQSKGKD